MKLGPRAQLALILGGTTVLVGAALILNARKNSPPAVAIGPLRHPAVVVGEKAVTAAGDRTRVASGEPISVEVTAYCLSGTTRRGRYVRPGIVAADPKIFPLSRYIELFIGGKYYGRFLVDDTGRNIRGARLDVWIASCREARIFGRRRGKAMLVARALPGVARTPTAR